MLDAGGVLVIFWGHSYFQFPKDEKCYFGGFLGVSLRAQAGVGRAAPGGKACASRGRCHATKCLLRRQTESQRDPVHPGIWCGSDG